MNNKGFAISIILYSIVLLISTMLFMILGIMRTRYNVSNRLRKSIMEDLNENMGYTSFTSSDSCTLVGSSDDYSNELILTIQTTGGDQYSFGDGYWDSNNTILVDHSGIYTGYFRDVVGGEGNCSAEIISKTMYQKRECAQNDYNFGNWYLAHENTCTDGVSLKEGGSSVNQSYAESHYLTYYYTSCTNSGSNTCCKEYNRNINSCKWLENEEWEPWQDVRPESTSSNQIKSATFYKIKK